MFSYLMPKIDLVTHFLSKNVYNYELGMNGSKVTALNIFYHFNVGTALNWS